MRRIATALALAAFGALALGSCVLGGSGISVDAIFADVGDLPRFANVQSSDVVIGSVRGIRLEGYHARVTMRLDPRARIPRNAVALVRSTSLLGEKFVDLRPPPDEPPASKPLRDGDVIPLERTARLPGVDDAFIELGRLLDGGNAAALASLIHSSAGIVRDREEALGRIFTELRTLTGILAVRAPDVARAIENLDAAFGTLARSSDAITRAVRSSADAVSILAAQQDNVDHLIGSLDRAAAVLARYLRASGASSDAALRDLRAVLDQVMRTTGDLEQALGALASFTDLWARAIPGDYIQLDIVLTLQNAGPSQVEPATVAADVRAIRRLQRLAELLWGPVG